MINLIPNKEKKEMVKAFYYRLLVLFLVTIGFSVFLIFVSILPSYFVSSVKMNFVNKKLENQKQELVPSPDQKILAEIKNIDTKLDVIENAENSQFSFSKKIINSVLANKISGIRIDAFSYQDNVVEGKKIKITGIASSRKALLLFRQSFEDDTAFKAVDLPISNFVKGTNIQFYLSLIPS